MAVNLPRQSVDLWQSASGTRVVAAVTTEPWELGLDALVLSVGQDGLGKLGYAVESALDLDLRRTDLAAVVPETPMLVDASNKRSPGLSWLVLASVRAPAVEKASAGDGTPSAIDLATRSVLNVADLRDFGSIGFPLLGTGVIGLDRGAVAEVMTRTIRSWLETRRSRLSSIVLFDNDPAAIDELSAAWQQTAAVPPEASGGGEPFGFTERAATVLRGVLSAAAQTGAASPVLCWFAALTYARRDARRDVAAALLAELVARSRAPGPDPLLATMASVLGVTRELDFATALPADLTEQLDWVLDAINIAYTTGSEIVRQRHLLTLAVSPDRFDPVLSSSLGMPVDELRAALRAAVASVKPEELPERWDALLLGAPTGSADAAQEPVAEAAEDPDNLAGGISADLVDHEKGIPLAEDRLGMATYVTMLATVIARADTPLPLSIGLFGEWGSGKSYFMGLLRQKVADLARSDEEIYHRHVEQISFNAWHYADTNLWASLGDEIFEELAGTRETADERRNRLRKELGESLERRKELNAATEQAHRETERLRTKLEAARRDRESSAKDLLVAIASTAELRSELQKAWRRLGVEDTVNQAELVVGEARGVRSDVATLRRVVAGPRGIAVLVAVALAFACLAAAAVTSTDVRAWLLRSGLGAFAAAAAYVAGLLAWARTGIRLLSRVIKQAQREAERDTAAQLTTYLAKVQRAEAREDVLNRQLNEINEQAGAISRELASLAPGQRLYSFIQKRAASGDYRRELGLISTIRHDFEQLIDIMDDWRKHPEKHDHQPPIDRIVLYIDDLDRCSAKQVVDVLQAVHLLLALELFVVVVGVDPRWLLQSLRQEYGSNMSGASTNPRANAVTPDVEWSTTPRDYLEKIFNIPFVLPGMTSDSFRELLTGLSAPAAAKPGGPAPRPAVEPESVTSPADTPPIGQTSDQVGPPPGTTPPTPQSAPITAEAGSEVAAVQRGVRARPRSLTKRELDMLAELSPLVETPREAKRLLNLYRTLRSTRDLSGAADFLADAPGGEFQAVALLLGLLSAQPDLVGHLLWAPVPDDQSTTIRGGLMFRSPREPWSTTWWGLEPRQGSDGGWLNDLGRLDEAQQAAWRTTVRRANDAAMSVSLPDISTFQKWGPQIARFSFVLSPLASAPQVVPTAAGAVAQPA